MGITLDIYKGNARKTTNQHGGKYYKDDYYICSVDSRTAWLLVGYLIHVQKIDTAECQIDRKIKVSVLIDFVKRLDSVSMFDHIRVVEDKIGVQRGWFSNYEPQELLAEIMYAKYDISVKPKRLFEEEYVIIDAGW